MSMSPAQKCVKQMVNTFLILCALLPPQVAPNVRTMLQNFYRSGNNIILHKRNTSLAFYVDIVLLTNTHYYNVKVNK